MYIASLRLEFEDGTQSAPTHNLIIHVFSPPHVRTRLSRKYFYQLSRSSWMRDGHFWLGILVLAFPRPL